MSAQKYIWLIVLGTIVLGLAVIAAVLEGRAMEQAVPDRSTYRFNTVGTRALYQTLRRLGYRVGRQLDDLRSIPAEAGELWIICPTQPFDREELKSLRSWVAHGNTLVCAYDQMGFSAVFGFGTIPKKSGEKPGRVLLGERRKAFEELAQIQPGIHDVLAFGPLAPMPEEDRGEWLSPQRREALTADVERVYVPNRLRVYPSGRRTEVLGTKTGSVMVTVPLEEGRIVFIADPDILVNRYLLAGDNAVLAVNVAQLRADKVVLFDEYHHGFRRANSLSQLAWTSKARWGIAQMALAGILLLIVQFKRFGRALPLPPLRRRVTQEYVDSLAEVYRAAGAREVAVWTLYQSARRHLASEAGLPAEVEDDVLARHAASRMRRSPDEIVQALAEARRLSEACPDDGALVLVARQLGRCGPTARTGGNGRRGA